MFQLNPENQDALEDAVVRAAEEHERRSYRSDGVYSRYFYLGDHDSSYPGLCIKYTDNGTLWSEHDMLQRIYALACSDGDAAPHVPQPIHYFHRSPTMMYLVMSHIEQQSVPPTVLVAKAASAVQWLHSKRYTAEQPFGIVPHTPVYHKLFKDRNAPFAFTSVAAAEKYLNTALRRIKRPIEPLAEISLTTEDVVLTQSDMDASNFGVAQDGRAIVFDAASIRGLPLSLADYTLFRTTPFATAVAECLFDRKEIDKRLCSPNLKSLIEVRRQLSWTYDARLGLNSDGDCVARPRTRIS
ncbi:hypothetical protein SISSUDRAFT_1065785 [Sistotremastrum suecicum HHB10207 ss-3]|uniref:Aminoglycoside phosphotransferase domain-containing protein n=1 Tax=Sistotremastrum suecicum HHB10207 ss-3 TaxID=1314776 RepID=A0A165Z2W2_9AGAM|nr:hypothetical protein SISSUDRAFT_1065785 [Sistotremastrum suecicum HHB10207 ss-3]